MKKIAKADDFHIAPFREDGKTYGTPTFIWSVEVDGDLYSRAYTGKESIWKSLMPVPSNATLTRILSI